MTVCEMYVIVLYRLLVEKLPQHSQYKLLPAENRSDYKKVLVVG